MLYITNWGTRQLMFRFHASAIPDDMISAYLYGDSMDWSSADEYITIYQIGTPIVEDKEL